jgi:hypothetical protein
MKNKEKWGKLSDGCNDPNESRYVVNEAVNKILKRNKNILEKFFKFLKKVFLTIVSLKLKNNS